MAASIDVFISYRRSSSWALARIIYDSLRQKGLHVFMDVESIREGDFDRVIVKNIEACTYFLVVLSPGTLEKGRIFNEKDWIRQEIELALSRNKRIVPVLTNDFSFPPEADLPNSLRQLITKNGVLIHPQYVQAAIDLLFNDFLCDLPQERKTDSDTGPSNYISGNDVIVNYSGTLRELTNSRRTSPPRMASTLFGRVDLFIRTRELLESGEIVLLHGLAGMGKSAIASAVTWSFSESFPGGVLWLEGVQSQLEYICDNIGFQLNDDEMQKIEAARKPIRVRVLLGSQPTLIVLDNCWDADLARSFARECVPAGCGLLVTSREKIAKLGALIEVTPLGDQPSIALFRHAASIPSGQEEEIKELISLLGGHPQALSVAGALCLEEELNVRELHKLLGSAEARIKRLSLGKDISNNIWATFDLSYQKLNTKEKEIFRLLGGAWAKGATVKLLAGAMETQLTDYDSIDSGLRGLAKRALVRTESIGEYKRYLMHNLVHDFAQSLIVDSGQTITELRLKWLTSVVTYVNYYCEDSPDNHTHLELELDNLLGAAAWAAEMGKWTEVDQIAIAMHEKSGFILRRGYASRAVGLLQLAREAAQNLGDKSHEGLHTGNLGMAFFEISDYTQALECYKVALNISRESGDKSNESRWLGSIGFVNDSLSRYSEAIKCYEGAIQIDREIGNQKGVGKWLGSAAGAYRLIGNSEKAVQYYEEAIQIARQMNDKVTEAVHLSNLGNAHRSWGWGNFQKAIECYSQAIQIARDTGDIMTEARATINSARVKSWLGNSEPALIELDHGLDLFTQIGFRSGQAYSHGYKGEIYRALGKQTEAKFETELALTIHKEVHVLHGQSDWLNNLGVWAGQDGRVEEGIHFLEDALEIRKKLGLAKVAETEMALKNLSDLLCKNLEKANE